MIVLCTMWQEKHMLPTWFPREPADLSASRAAHPKLRAAGVKPRWCEPWGTQAKRSAALLPPPHIQASPTTSSLIFDASWDVDKKLND